MAHQPPRRRVHPIAGMVLPFVAFLRLVRDPETRGTAYLGLSLFAIGTAFYSLVEGWSVIDAFYFSTVTLATVGFGDLAPSSAGARLFTAFYVLAGVGILVAFFADLARATLAVREERARRRDDPHPGG